MNHSRPQSRQLQVLSGHMGPVATALDSDTGHVHCGRMFCRVALAGRRTVHQWTNWSRSRHVAQPKRADSPVSSAPTLGELSPWSHEGADGSNPSSAPILSALRLALHRSSAAALFSQLRVGLLSLSASSLPGPGPRLAAALRAAGSLGLLGTRVCRVLPLSKGVTAPPHPPGDRGRLLSGANSAWKDLHQ